MVVLVRSAWHSPYHVVVHERATLLNEPCHSEGQVLHRPVRHCAPEGREPLKQDGNVKLGNSQHLQRFHKISMSWAQVGSRKLPSSPGLGPHCWLVVPVRGEGVAVEAIAGINLPRFKQGHLSSLFDNRQQSRCSSSVQHTTGSGASSCLHMTHGTPVLVATAIFAAQFAYGLAPRPPTDSIGPNSFSTCTYSIQLRNQAELRSHQSHDQRTDNLPAP